MSVKVFLITVLTMLSIPSWLHVLEIRQFHNELFQLFHWLLVIILLVSLRIELLFEKLNKKE